MNSDSISTTEVAAPAPRAGLARRALAALFGVAIFLFIALVTVGVALVAPLGMWIAARVRRGRAYSRWTGWWGAVLATALVFGVLVGVAAARAPDGFMDTVRQQVAEERERRQKDPSSIERVVQRLAPASGASPAVELRARAVTESKPFIIWTMIIGGGFAVALGAVLVGSTAWVGMKLIIFGITGRSRRREVGARVIFFG